MQPRQQAAHDDKITALCSVKQARASARAPHTMQPCVLPRTRARQARARSVAVGRAGLAAAARGLATAIPTYPVEAAVALSNSMQADELDDR